MREKSIFKIVLKVGFKIRPGHWGIIVIIFPCLSKNNLFSNMQFILPFPCNCTPMVNI